METCELGLFLDFSGCPIFRMLTATQKTAGKLPAVFFWIERPLQQKQLVVGYDAYRDAWPRITITSQW